MIFRIVFQQIIRREPRLQLGRNPPRTHVFQRIRLLHERILLHRRTGLPERRLFGYGPEEQCDLDGILCLNDHYGQLSVQKTKWGEKEGLVCDCLPGCADPEYNIISTASETM
ncbi:unnamed protein product [Nesidiocoris tenuis]|uniref:Uncharacterized protein n=1 Tax=Nesidiocoris tenuis TaxID=355587 RepID=A0A6H5HS48_9HEMI|nr:unnamed protein product [Nesidiocoris tenuis]